MEAYVLEHQDIHRRLMKADPQGKTEASTHHANMTKFAIWAIGGTAADDELPTVIIRIPQ